MAAYDDVHLVVMAGGSGTRFWPKSTSKKPKQLLSFGTSQQSLLVQTLKRFPEIPASNRWIATTEALAEACRKEVGQDARVLAEPQGRNTAPCIYWAAKEIEKVNKNAVMVVMPSDHFILNLSKFKSVIMEAVNYARNEPALVTLGIQPSRPETGYGYLKVGGPIKGSCRKVEAFVEKPSLEKAESFLKNGNYLWNGGMFLWSIPAILQAFHKQMPEMERAWAASDGDVKRAYPQMTATSIDFGVMEKADNVVTLALDCGWDDVGSWLALESLAPQFHWNKPGGTVISGELLALESDGNIVDVPERLVAVLGLKNLVVVDTGRVLLVADKSQSQDIKRLVERVKKERPELA